MAFAWGCYPHSAGRFRAEGYSRPSKRKRPKSSRHKLLHSAGEDSCTDTNSALGLCETLKKELKRCESSASARERLKEKSKDILYLMRQLENIIQEVTTKKGAVAISELVTKSHSGPETFTAEQLAVLFTEKDNEIKVLKEQCEKKAQQIKMLQEQIRDHCEHAKEFEINFRVEAEENQLLRTENQDLKTQLDSGFSNGSEDECDLVTCEADGLKKVVTGLKTRVKDLNEDVVKLRNHSKEQSRQILKYKQQVEVSDMMEGQLESMERIQHEAKEECFQMHNKLQTATQELKKLQNEKDIMNREHSQLERNLMSMGDLSSQLVEARRATAQLKQQLESKESELTMLKAQLAACNPKFKQERETLVRAEVHCQVTETEKKGAHVKRPPELGKIDYCSEYEDLQHNYQVICKQLAEERESLSTLKQENVSLKQEIGARSSQVKQYAKEVDRLKRQLDSLPSKYPSTNTYESPTKCTNMDELDKTAEKDIEYLSGEKSRCHEQIESLKRENAQLRRLLALSPTVSKHDGYVSAQKPLMQANLVLGPLQDSADILDPVSPLTGEKHSQRLTQGGCLVTGDFDDVECDNPHFKKAQHSRNLYKNQTLAPVQEGVLATTKLDLLSQNIQPPSSPCKHPSLSASKDNSIQASNPLEDSVVLFENPLQRELDDEIHQQAAQVIQEVSGSRREVNTDIKRPFDPNLVCPMCRKQFRIGEIQRFRRHVNTCTGTSGD